MIANNDIKYDLNTENRFAVQKKQRNLTMVVKFLVKKRNYDQHGSENVLPPYALYTDKNNSNVDKELLEKPITHEKKMNKKL